MDTLNLSMSFSGYDTISILREIVAAQFGGALPVEVRSDQKDRKVSASWIDAWAASARVSVEASFSDDEIFGPRVSMEPGKVVKLDKPETARAIDPLLEFLAALPFELAVAGRIHSEWRDVYQMRDGASFADGHVMHGLLCAFKGAGHARLVSRRWLEFGPWKLYRLANDTSVVLFHSLAANATTALAQARPGHRRMGISNEGGFLQSNFVFAHGLDGDYDAASRRLLIDAPAELGPSHMLEACAMRHDQTLGHDRPIEHVGFSFGDRGVAERHVHELWLRELECHVGGDRLDLDYHADPQPPPWAG